MDLHGRVVVITGATSGIGRATALALARMGATLGLVDRARADATVAEIAAATGNRDVAVFLADLGSQATSAGSRASSSIATRRSTSS